MLVECYWPALTPAALHLNTCLTTQTWYRTRLMQLDLLGSVALLGLGDLPRTGGLWSYEGPWAHLRYLVRFAL